MARDYGLRAPCDAPVGNLKQGVGDTLKDVRETLAACVLDDRATLNTIIQKCDEMRQLYQQMEGSLTKGQAVSLAVLDLLSQYQLNLAGLITGFTVNGSALVTAIANMQGIGIVRKLG